MYIKRMVNGEEFIIEITEKEKVEIMKEYLFNVEEHLVFLENTVLDEEEDKCQD